MKSPAEEMFCFNNLQLAVHPVKNKTYYYSVYRSTIKKNIDFDSLVKIECIDLQMSTIDHSYVEVVDKRVLRK